MLYMFFSQFPKAILGAMLIYIAVLLGRIAFKEFNLKTFPIILISAIICFIFNIALGFLIGLILFLIFKKKIDETKKEKDNSENP